LVNRLEHDFPTRQFNWQQVDERLSSIVQGKVSANIRELIHDDVGHIRFQNMTNQNSMTVPLERLRMQLLRSERVGRTTA
jgi:hypothetical protein